MSDVHRLVHGSGTSGGLVLQAPWSAEVVDLDGPDPTGWLREAERWAVAHDVLDLRSRAGLPAGRPVVEGGSEHVRPVPVPLADPDATRALGRRVAGALRPGDLVVLSGPLGAGKTTFTQGVGEALGVRGRVTSPTFVLARVHRAGPSRSVPLVHVDAYRLRDAADSGRPVDLDDLDLDAALESAVTVVEWGAGLVDRLADSWVEVRLARPGADDGDDVRTAEVVVHGPRWELAGFGPV